MSESNGLVGMRVPDDGARKVPGAQDVLDAIRELARTELRFTGSIDLEDRLIEDLHLDSLSLSVIALGLEMRIGVALPFGTSTVETVADVVRLVQTAAVGR